MMKTIIQNGRVIDPVNELDTITNITIDNGVISHIGPEPSTGTEAQIIDAKNMWVIPGLVDACCRPHLQHPHGSTLADEAKAAAKCGFTTLCIPPDGDLIIDSTANVARLKQQAEDHLPRVYPIGALTKQLLGESMTDMSALSAAGCIALSQAMQPIKDLNVLKHCYQYASSFDLLIVIQPFEPALSHGIVHEGEISAKLGLPGISTTCETIAIAQHLALIKETGVRAHFTCLSSLEGVALIRQAKKEGLPVTADCAMHSLHLTERDIIDFDANCHVYPPLRSLEDKNGLIEGLRDGTLDAICSDHRPLDSVAKLAPFGDTVPGLSSIDTFLGLGLQLISSQHIPLLTLLKAMTQNPARIFNLNAGTLSVGTKADICLLDPKRSYQVTEKSLHSGGKNSPFKGWNLQGQVIMTLKDGMIVHES